MKDKKDKLTFKEFISNKQYRAILYLGVYFIIFLVLILMVRLSPNKISTRTNTKEDTIITEGFNSIKNKNYNFKYTLSIDGKEETYIGKQNNDKILFTYLNDEFFINGGVNSKKQGTDYIIKKDGVYKYFDFFDIALLEKIFEKSEENGENHKISLTNFIEIIGSDINVENDDFLDVKIVKHNNIITEIDIDLTKYALLLNEKIENVSLKLEYSNFNLIDEFDIE